MKFTENNRKISRRDLLSLGAKGLGLFALVKVGIACGGDNNPQPTTQETFGVLSKTPIESSTAQATAVPTPEPTLTPVETQPPVPCQIVEETYCGGGKIDEWKDPASGVILKLIHLNVSQRTPIYSPFNGQFMVRQKEQNPLGLDAPLISVYNDEASNTPIFAITGNIEMTADLNPLNTAVKKGDIIGYVQETEENVSDGNIIISFTSLDPLTKTFTTDESLIRQYFPSITK